MVRDSFYLAWRRTSFRVGRKHEQQHLDAMSFVSLEVDDFELLQTIFPFRQHGVIGEETDSVELHRRPVCDKFFPVFL